MQQLQRIENIRVFFSDLLLNFEKMSLDINQSNPYSTLVSGDSNARSSSWSDDINTTEETELLSLIYCHGFQQIIN